MVALHFEKESMVRLSTVRSAQTCWGILVVLGLCVTKYMGRGSYSAVVHVLWRTQVPVLECF